jgi:excisionase family DNA binding protein
MSDQLTLAIPAALIDGIAQRVVELLRHDRSLEPEEQPASPWLTFDQACAYLGFSRDALYKLTAARAIPFRKKQGGQGLRFHRDELDAWMETQYPRLDRLP